MEKLKKYAGADESTPSKSEYFSWISSTNEGSTEKQTLINLDYFGYLKKAYNMQLDIYALDAGNLDGAEGTYETENSPKIKKQYPRGYGPVAEKAKSLGCRMGIWGGIDGYGDTEESAAARKEQMVSLARDYNFALFKFDTVCGILKTEHEKYFIEMMEECRRHVPDFILLNHRVPLSPEAQKYATTFLWEGLETYVDVHISNRMTAPHHRAFMMDRGQTPGMVRLTEDHGVCLSSHLDYFEDDLIIQSFSRCLLLAPEIYGNPWLLRDFEQSRLARIFNLHRRYRDILVKGFVLDENGTVSRGDGERRFIVGANMSWYEKKLVITLDASVGLEPCEKVTVCAHHPFEKYVGEFGYGETVTLPLQSFRAFLFEVCASEIADVMLEGCEYEVLHEDENGKIDKVKLISSEGAVKYTDGRELCETEAFNSIARAPRLLCEIGEADFAPVPENSEKQLETALFVQDHDSLEARSLKRAGETKIPEVKAARDAFFAQKTYAARGCESAFAFDGKADTFFDGISKTFFLDDGFRVDGGCLRVDFGDVYEADAVRFEFFSSDMEQKGYFAAIAKQKLPDACDFSIDLEGWRSSLLKENGELYREDQEVIVSNLHSFKAFSGSRSFAEYEVGGKIRYFRMPRPLDRIHKIALVKNGTEIELKSPRANNLLPYGRDVLYCKELSVIVPKKDCRDGCYLSVCLEGIHGREGAYAVLECDGKYFGAPDRAPGYGTNAWECYAIRSFETDSNYTYYFPVEKNMTDKIITVRILGVDGECKDFDVRVFLCDGNNEPFGIVKNI